MRRHDPELARQNRIRIIEAAEIAFRTQGIKEVTMDSIAHGLKMSKRTVYEMFTSKEALLLECVKAFTERKKLTFEQIHRESENALEVLIRIMEFSLRELETYSNKAFQSIEIYPSVQAYLLEERRQSKDRSIALCQRGIEEGYFRVSVNPEIVYTISQQLLTLALSEESLSAYTPSELFRNTVLLYYSGCVTPKGSAILEDFFERYR